MYSTDHTQTNTRADNQTTTKPWFYFRGLLKVYSRSAFIKLALDPLKGLFYVNLGFAFGDKKNKIYALKCKTDTFVTLLSYCL